MIDHQVQQIFKQDVPQLLACGGVFSFCTLTNVASVAQAIGIIAASIGAVVIVIHRIYSFIKEINE